MLHIHRAERADGLAAALAELLSEPLDDPFALELVAVPTRGMERWLSQRLSEHLGAHSGRGDGVCAGVLFPPPRRLIGDALAAASGVDPEEDPWLPERAVWPLVAVIDEQLDAPWLQTLASYLGGACDAEADPVRRARRLGAARHLSGLYHRYALHRPEMVGAWARGEDTDGSARALPPDAVWQSELWRALRARIGQAGLAERLAPACRRLRADPDLVDLPPRVSLFGLTRLPAGDLHVLRALAEQRDVHLFLLHPSPALWHAVASSGVLRAGDAGGPPHALTRRDDPTAGRAANPLLASWGRDSRELQVILAAGEDDHADHHHALALTPRTLLQRLQADVLADRAPPGAPFPPAPDERIVLAGEDRSIQIHACHGRARQVEVLRDAVLHLLAQDTTLEPRDVIVMCPDIEAFAPLIQATFGAGEPPPDADAADRLSETASDPIDLRVRLADRSLRQTNPILAAVAELLELAGQRVTASQVLGFADREPVRRRFGLRDDDLSRLQRWISDSGIRWGLDAAHRAPFKLDALSSGTWRAGLDRLLLGVSMTEEGSRLFEGVLPLDDVESGAIELAGRLAELVDRLAAAVDALSQPQSVEAWAAALADAADALTVAAPREVWQRVELQRVLDDLLAEADATLADAASTPTLALAEIRALVADRLAGRPTRANFRTGHLTVCTLYPMRSVPHRVVCLLGLDDGAFPRKAPRDGDDLMLADPRVGERDPRSEDRQLLLDGLLAATEHLVVTYTGNDERTNLPRPPAVPVGELLDAIDATARTPSAGARDQVLVRHPLQPFDRRNFSPGELVTGRAWSFDRVMLAGARALELPPAAARPFLSAPLPPRAEEVIALEDLVRFVQHPVRAFLRQRLRIYLGEIDDEVDDALPVELDGLERWGVGQRLLDAALAGTDGRAACLAEIARGTLPPGQLGEPVVRRLYPIVAAIERETEASAPSAEPPAPLDVHVALPDGRLLSGTVPGVRGDVLLTSTFSRVAAKHRLSAWVRLLAATASAPERELGAVTIGRGTRENDITVVRIHELASDPVERRRAAEAHLATLVELFDRGMREPLPLFCATSAAYATAAASGEDAIAAAQKHWDSNYKFDGEGAELEHQLVLGGLRSLAEVLERPPEADEWGESWQESETSRFGRLARRLWDGLLACEERRTG